MKLFNVCIGSVFFIGCLLQQSYACTVFQLKNSGEVYIGKNFDWIVGDGLLYVNKRGMSKKAIHSFFDKKGSSDQLASWVSKYGSVTYNLFGREFGYGGMNETGLVIESLALSDTKTHKPDSRPSVSAVQFVQYLLDNYSTVEEVIESENSIRLTPTIQPSGHRAGHLFVADKSGNSAVIEYIKGKRVYYTNVSMPYKALTNSTYHESIDYYGRNIKPRRDVGKSIERFFSTVDMLLEYNPDFNLSPLDYSFRILEEARLYETISIGKLEFYFDTKWSFVYELNRLQIHFRTNGNQNTRTIDLKSFDFSCSTPVKVIDINAPLSGDISGAFVDYTPQINNNMVENVFKQTPYPFLYGPDFKFYYYLVKSGFKEFPEHPPENIERLLAYPDKTVCFDRQ